MKKIVKAVTLLFVLGMVLDTRASELKYVKKHGDDGVGMYMFENIYIFVCDTDAPEEGAVIIEWINSEVDPCIGYSLVRSGRGESLRLSGNKIGSSIGGGLRWAGPRKVSVDPEISGFLRRALEAYDTMKAKKTAEEEG